MTHPEIIKNLQNIKRLSESPLCTTTAQHIQALITILSKDAETELQQAQKELNLPVPGKMIPQHFGDLEEVVNEVVMDEFDYQIEISNSMEAKRKYDYMRKRIVTKIMDKITGKTNPTIPVIQSHAIRNFDLANKFWSWQDKIKAVNIVFPDTDYDARLHEYRCDLYRFFEILSEDQQSELISYVMDNYKGVPLENS